MSQPVPSRSRYSRYIARRTLQELRRATPVSVPGALVSRTTQGTTVRPLVRAKPGAGGSAAYYA